MTVSIRPLTDELIQGILRKPPEPHRHAFQEVVLLTAGGGSHLIDGEHHVVLAPCAILVARGKMHQLLPGPGSTGWILNFDEERLPPESDWLFSQFFAASHLTLPRAGTCHQVLRLATLMHEIAEDPAASHALTHLLLALLDLLRLELQSQVLGRDEATRGDFQAFADFLRLVDQHHRREKSVAFYVHQMKTTARRLAALSKAFLGRTTLQVIEDRCMREARRLLVFTDEPIQQIADTLGYADPSYFTKVFRRSTGEAPAAYRQAHRTGIHQDPTRSSD